MPIPMVYYKLCLKLNVLEFQRPMTLAKSWERSPAHFEKIK